MFRVEAQLDEGRSRTAVGHRLRASRAAVLLLALTLASACGGGGDTAPGGGTPGAVDKGPGGRPGGSDAPQGPRDPDKGGGQRPPASAPVEAGGESGTPGAPVVGGNTTVEEGTTPPATADAATLGAWSALLHWPVVAIHAALTPDGRLLSFGTRSSDRDDNVFYYDVWDPLLGTGAQSHTTLENTTGTFLFCGSVIASPLTGRMLINGGDVVGPDGRVTNEPTPDINLFDPGTSVLRRAGTLQRPRWYSTSTTLMDGNVFVQGGKGGNDYAEVVDGNGISIRLVDGWKNDDLDNNYPRNWIAPTGRIFGFDAGWPYIIDLSANGGRGARRKLPDQWLRGWSATSTAAMYAPGQVVVMGGADPRITHIDIGSDSPAVTPGPDLPEERQWLNATVLPDGKIFVSGGTEKNPLEDQPDNREVGKVPYHTYLYDPQARKLARTSPLTQIRTYHSISILLPDASVLTSGGGEPGPVTNLNAEIYHPPYLYNADGTPAVRPRLSAAPLSADPASTIEVSSPDAPDIARMVLMKSGAVTHSNDMEQRRVPVEFTMAGDRLRVQLPANANLTPPGYYMLFAINGKGVPSMARIIRINVRS